jgi:hypothetical protein
LSTAKADANTQDPYQILTEHSEAIGGMDKAQSIQTLYARGSVVILGSDLAGEFEVWKRKPLPYRMSIDWGIMRTVSGDNGDYPWRIDANGKIQTFKDEHVLNQREIQRLMRAFEYLDPASPYFDVSYEGRETVGNHECDVVKITNTIDATVIYQYYDNETRYLLEEIIKSPDNEEHKYYDDHRTVDGVIFPFRETVETILTGEKQEYIYTAIIVNPEIGDSVFEPPSIDVEDFVFANGKSTENVRFEFIENNIYVPVVIQGREQLWVLDCGASVTVIDSSYAADLGMAFQGPIKAQSPTGAVDLYYVTMPAFSLQGITFAEQTVMTMNLRHIFKKLLGLEIAGILGYDFLSRLVTRIDYANEQLSFYHPEVFKYQGPGAVIDAPLDEQLIFNVPANVDDKYVGTWGLDIGANGVDFYYPYARTHDLLDRPGMDIMFYGAAGPGMARRSRFKSMSVSDYVIEDMVIAVPQQEAHGFVVDTARLGNIGNTFLRHFVLYLDYHRQQVIFEKGVDFGRRFPEQKSGLGLSYDQNNNLAVLYVAPATPAEESGFKKGDVIIAINNIGLEYFDGIIAMRSLFREPVGTRYVFTIDRNGKIMDLSLILRDLL